jgi:hypothetical protein
MSLFSLLLGLFSAQRKQPSRRETTVGVFAANVTIRFEGGCGAPSSRTPPSQERDSRIKPAISLEDLSFWRCPGCDYQTKAIGMEHYAAEVSALFSSPRELRATFEAMLIPEENFYDENAIAVYRVGGGQVGHIPRFRSGDWRPLIDEMYLLARVLPLCSAEASRADPGYPEITLDITLAALKAEVKRLKRDARESRFS